MSKKILVFAVLFSIVISMGITQEASALTKASGQYSRTTASLDPSRVCGSHICYPGESSRWTSAVQESQRQGPGKATGAQYGYIIMHQMVVNSWWMKSTSQADKIPGHSMPAMIPMKMSNSTMANSARHQ